MGYATVGLDQVSDAEALAAKETAKLAIQIASDEITELCPCLDNLNVAQRVQFSSYAHGTSLGWYGK